MHQLTRYRTCCLAAITALALRSAAPPARAEVAAGGGRNQHLRSLRIEELGPSLAGKEVTVQFTVDRLQGVAQRGTKGQSPTFIIQSKPQPGTRNQLDVWIEGDLTNILHRLQLAFLQENALKAGTGLLATGTLRVHAMDAHTMSLSVDKWQNFRILGSAERETE